MRDRVPAGVARFARAPIPRPGPGAAGFARLCGGGAPFAGNAQARVPRRPPPRPSCWRRRPHG